MDDDGSCLRGGPDVETPRKRLFYRRLGKGLDAGRSSANFHGADYISGVNIMCERGVPAFMIHGPFPGFALPMAVEAFHVVLLVVAWRYLPHHKLGEIAG